MSVKCHPEEHRWLCSCWVFVSIGIVFPSFGIVPLVSLGIVLSVSRFDDKQTVDWFRPYLLPSHLKSAQDLNAWRLLLQLSHFSNPPFLCGKLQDPKVWHLLLPLYQFCKCQPLPPMCLTSAIVVLVLPNFRSRPFLIYVDDWVILSEYISTCFKRTLNLLKCDIFGIPYIPLYIYFVEISAWWDTFLDLDCA